MDYIFNEDIFKKNFNFQELGEDGSGTDALRLRHNPDKNFRLFPYKVNKNERYFVRDISEVVSDFLKLVMGIESNGIDNEKLMKKLKENIDIDENEIPIFETIIHKMFFRDGKFLAKNIELYAYQPYSENKSIHNLAFFLYCVLGIGEHEHKLILSLKEKHSKNVLEDLVSQSILKCSKVINSNEKKYFPIIEGIQDKFKKDFEFMLLHDMTDLEDITALLDLYYFYYISQTAVVLDNFCSGNRKKTVEFYYALDWEKVSGNRKCCLNGWKGLQQKINHLFSHAITLELINQHDDESLMYDYIMLGEYVADNQEKDREVACKIQRTEATYIECIGDYKKFSEIPEPFGKTETEKAIKHLFECVKEQFYNTKRTEANESYFMKFVNYAKGRWLKNRRKLGMVLNLTERDIIFLTKISLGDSDKIKLEELFREYNLRGIFLDNASKKLLQEFFTKLNLIDKKSDSGDAQYVKRIL